VNGTTLARVDTEVIDAAWRRARKAAADCGIEVVELSGDRVAVGQAIVREAWGPQQVPQGNLLQALSHAGNAVLAAVHGDHPAGVAFGFLGWHQGLHLHSHMTAVTPGRQSRGVGFALKLWQRATCLEHGVTEMRWTYDPLIARNAYFNLVKLGAQVQGFYPEFYGDMDDTVNSGDRSDRFEVSWLLDAERTIAALERGGESGVGIDGRPVGELVVIPPDFDALRRADPEAAQEMRLASRSEFSRCFGEGLTPKWGGEGYVFVETATVHEDQSDTGRG
jgi:predicted GNAT superfamily acetyltransferase